MTLYESAIYECGKILSYYDSDKVYPVYGFGANIIGEQGVSHCFPLTLDPNDNADINGLNNVLIAYRNVLPKLNFSGPTYFEPLLTQIFTTVASMDNKQMNYNIVLLLTDGMINDMQKTVDLIVGANDLPISLIIVGVGNADFSKIMRRFRHIAAPKASNCCHLRLFEAEGRVSQVQLRPAGCEMQKTSVFEKLHCLQGARNESMKPGKCSRIQGKEEPHGMECNGVYSAGGIYGGICAVYTESGVCAHACEGRLRTRRISRILPGTGKESGGRNRNLHSVGRRQCLSDCGWKRLLGVPG